MIIGHEPLDQVVWVGGVARPVPDDPSSQAHLSDAHAALATEILNPDHSARWLHSPCRRGQAGTEGGCDAWNAPGAKRMHRDASAAGRELGPVLEHEALDLQGRDPMAARVGVGVVAVDQETLRNLQLGVSPRCREASNEQGAKKGRNWAGIRAYGHGSRWFLGKGG